MNTIVLMRIHRHHIQQALEIYTQQSTGFARRIELARRAVDACLIINGSAEFKQKRQLIVRIEKRRALWLERKMSEVAIP